MVFRLIMSAVAVDSEFAGLDLIMFMMLAWVGISFYLSSKQLDGDMGRLMDKYFGQSAARANGATSS